MKQPNGAMRDGVCKRGPTWAYTVRANGKKVWRGGFRTRAEAVAARRAALTTLDNGGDPFPTAVTLTEFVHDRWVPHLRTVGKPREATWRRYVELLDRWVLPDLGHVHVAKVGPRHVQPVLDKVTEAGKSPRTAQHVRAALSAAFTQAMRWQLVTTNPVHATMTPTAQPPDLRTPTADEVATLVAAAVGTPWEVPVLLSATTGARRAEVLAVRWSGIDLDANRVRVVAVIVEGDDGLTFGPPKTKNATRTVPLPPFVVERLRAHKAAQARRRLALGTEWHDLDLVCEQGNGQPISPGAFTHGFLRLAARADLDGVRLHDLRHAYATEARKRNVDPLALSRILGHASPAFTMATYQHIDDEMLDRAAEGLTAMFATGGT